VSLEGGRIRDHGDLPTGGAFRVAATLGSAFGGDLDGNRYEVDGRAFLPLTPDTRLGLRLRGGYATSDTPVQTQFAIGGIGSVRSYDQNARRGTRLLLGNAEYIIDGATLDDDFLDDLFLVGLFDTGWVGNADRQFQTDDVLTAAGFGIGLDERDVRLDVTWPLRDVPATGSSPSIWLRITPNF
jgi:hemolysin activation/secretion protein